MTHLVDIDNTLNNLMEMQIAYLNNKYDQNVKLEDVTDYYLPRSFPLLTCQQVEEPLFLPEFQKSLRPISDSQKYMKMLHDEGDDIYICTAADYRIFRSKVEFIMEYFPFIDVNKIGRWAYKQMIEAAYLIDDWHVNLVNGVYRGIMFEYAWNKDFNNEEYGITRANNWQEIYRAIKG